MGVIEPHKANPYRDKTLKEIIIELKFIERSQQALRDQFREIRRKRDSNYQKLQWIREELERREVEL